MSALERQIRPIYDSLDIGSNKSAIVTCNKLLKKYPKNELVKALKALALVRSQKVEESLVLCDEVLAGKPTDDAVLTAMTHVLRGLGRHTDTISMFEAAFKQAPDNEDLGAQTFFANVRAGNWKSAQQTATKMWKQFQNERYLYWSVMSSILQANESSTAPKMRTVLYTLAHRLITSSPSPPYVNADRFHLHLVILRELRLFDEARTLLESDVGKGICATSLVCDEVRRDIWKIEGLWEEEGKLAEKRIVEKKDRNWLEFLSVLDGTFADSSSPENTVAERVAHARDLFEQVAAQDGPKDRSGLLALLELEKRSKERGLSADPTRIVDLMEKYFQQVGSKACCFEDLKPFLSLLGEDLTRWTDFLNASVSLIETINDLQKSINKLKLLRYNLTPEELTPAAESAHAALYVQSYLAGLKFGAGLESTELQPADDLAILAGSAFVNIWHTTRHDESLYNAASLLEFALGKSKQSFLMRLMLVRIYRILGAPSLALEHYRSIKVKQIQMDTLSHLVLSRASTFSLAASGDLTLLSECMDSSQIYASNSQETSDYIIRAFTSEKYSQIPEFILFEDMLDNSLHRDTVKMEHVRMRYCHEPVTSDVIDLELIELKFIFDRYHHDNRDFDIIPNYQPRAVPSLNEQTLLFGKSEGLGWLWIFLNLYIQAYQQASDLDETVEEKLLIGDRPKFNSDTSTKPSLKTRLAEASNDTNLAELTSEELIFFHYADSMAKWLEPFHTYLRPHPSVVLAQAAKQTELKPGHPLKGLELLPSENGHKKTEEPPTAVPASESILNYFETMKAQFALALDKKEHALALHIATLTQESLVLLHVESLRFKSPSAVKTYKLGPLIQSFKTLKTSATEVLKHMAAQLSKTGEAEATAENRKMIVESCKPLIGEQIDRDFVLDVAAKIADARKKVFEGIGKGIPRVCSLYSH